MAALLTSLLLLSAALAALAPSPLASFANATVGSPIGSQQLERRAGKGDKAVFAHIVQGVFQNYAQQDYENDCTMALTAGIAAFAMNVGHDATDGAQMDKAFAAAEVTGMKLFFSFDMVYFSNAEGSNWIFDEYMKPYAASPAHYTFDGKVFISTFSGEVPGRFLDATASLEESNAKWSALFERIKTELGLEVYFAPNWNDVKTVSSNTWSGGHLFWEAWAPKGSADDLTLDTANSYMAACQEAGLDLIAPVSAFFHVHQRPDNNYVYNSNNFLLFYHYTALISMDPGPQFIELLSWNDAGESHYLGPTKFDPPTGSENYAHSDFDHTPLLTASAYYNLWFVNGAPPAIKTEAIVWYYRPHPKDLVAASDPVPKPEGAETMDDAIYVAVFVPPGSKAASVIVTTGGEAGEPTAVAEGVNLVQVPLVAGETGVDLVDGSGASLLSGKGVPIDSSIEVYNFNYRAYILPEGADASVLFGTEASETVSEGELDEEEPAAASPTSKAATGDASQTTTGTTTTRAGASSIGSSPSVVSATSGTAKPTATPGGDSSGSSSSNPSPSTTTEQGTQGLFESLNNDWMGLKIYCWLFLLLVIPILALIAYIVTSHGKHAPSETNDGQEHHRKRLLGRDSEGSDEESFGSDDGRSDEEGRRRR